MKLVGPVKVMRQGNIAVTVNTSVVSGIFEDKPFSTTIQLMTA